MKTWRRYFFMAEGKAWRKWLAGGWLNDPTCFTLDESGYKSEMSHAKVTFPTQVKIKTIKIHKLLLTLQVLTYITYISLNVIKITGMSGKTSDTIRKVHQCIRCTYCTKVSADTNPDDENSKLIKKIIFNGAWNQFILGFKIIRSLNRLIILRIFAQFCIHK